LIEKRTAGSVVDLKAPGSCADERHLFCVGPVIREDRFTTLEPNVAAQARRTLDQLIGERAIQINAEDVVVEQSETVQQNTH
jgi:hypothetical protein